jgi:ClpP class serine protease
VRLATYWFLTDDALRNVLDAFSRFDFDQERYEAFIERVSTRDPGAELIVADGVARIPILGTLTNEPDFFFSIFGGGATYGDIRALIAAAEGNNDVERIVLEIDSPGGEVAGFFATAAAIAATKKPTEAQVTNIAASAAFGLASQADRITVDNPMAMVGSVGISTTRFVSETRVVITSTDAPRKNPNAATDEGVAVIRAELDSLHREFAGVIARGRGVELDTVNSDFGRGGMVIAGDALQAGMIDSINLGRTPQTQAKGNQAMTLEEFKAQYPALYAAIFASGREEGVTAGVARERDRVLAHVTTGKNSGPDGLKIAAGFIEDGSDFTSQMVQAKYLTAGRNAAETDDRADDDDDAKAADDKKPTADGSGAPNSDKETNALFDGLESDFGVDTGAKS